MRARRRLGTPEARGGRRSSGAHQAGILGYGTTARRGPSESPRALMISACRANQHAVLSMISSKFFRPGMLALGTRPGVRTPWLSPGEVMTMLRHCHPSRDCRHPGCIIGLQQRHKDPALASPSWTPAIKVCPNKRRPGQQLPAMVKPTVGPRTGSGARPHASAKCRSSPNCRCRAGYLGSPSQV